MGGRWCRCSLPTESARSRESDGQAELLLRGGDEGGDADAEEAERAGDEAVAGEEEAGEAIDLALAGDGVFDADLAGEGGEVAVADFDLDGEGSEAVPIEGGGDVMGHLFECGAEGGAVVGVLAEGVLGADAFAFFTEVQGAIVLAEGALFEAVSERADHGHQVERGVLEVGDGFEAFGFEGLGGDGADAVDGADGEGAEKGDAVRIPNEGEAIGFLEVATEFGEEFVGGDADAGGELALGADAGFDGFGDGQDGGEGGIAIGRGGGGSEGGEVEVGFIDRDLFDEGGELLEQEHDLGGFGAIGVHARADEDALGAEPAGGAGGHGGADLEAAGFVASGADDAALVGWGADDEGFATILGLIPLLDGGEEGIHIDMEDDAGHAEGSRSGR
jgi:hypothetical protein